jgi:hypothetical protein
MKNRINHLLHPARGHSSVGAERQRRSGAATVPSPLVGIGILALVSLPVGAFAATNQFVILSDIQPARGAEYQVGLLEDQLLQIDPAFVIQLGDFEGGGSLPGWMEGADSALQIFHALREARIDVYPVIGNHDQGIDKHRYICNHEPPLNPELDPALNPDIHERWCGSRRYWYSFNRFGVHFVIIDSNLNPSHEAYSAQIEWLRRDLCRGEGNPNRLPVVLLMHDVGYLGCDTRSGPGPVYRILEECPDHPVVAAFGGHWHSGQTFPPENNLGVLCYATEASSILTIDNPEYIVATLHQDRITFESVDTKTGGPGKTGLVYLPLAGSPSPWEEAAK